jgi:hypothetical protein
MTESSVDFGPVVPRPSVLAMPRRRGTVIGVVLVLLGLWGGLSPLIGPWLGYHIDDEQAWTLTWDRLWLTTIPGAAVLVGGIVLFISKDRLSAAIGAWLAMAGGAWFVVGPSVSALWSSTFSTNGIGRSNTTQRLVEQLASFYALGALVVALTSFALARVLIRSEHDAVRLQNEAAASLEAVRLREERERAQAEADQAAQARADAEREYQRAQQEREQVHREHQYLQGSDPSDPRPEYVPGSDPSDPRPEYVPGSGPPAGGPADRTVHGFGPADPDGPADPNGPDDPSDPDRLPRP